MDCITYVKGDYLVQTQRKIRGVETDAIYTNDPTYVLGVKFIGLFFLMNPIRLPFQIIHYIVEFSRTPRSITVVKFFLLPLGFLAREIICVLGLFFAYHARKWYAKVEQFFYLPPKDIFEPHSSLELLGNFTAPCMQPHKFYKENNLFRYWDENHYNRNTTRSLLAQIKHITREDVSELEEEVRKVAPKRNYMEAQMLRDGSRSQELNDLANRLLIKYNKLCESNLINGGPRLPDESRVS